MAVLGTPRGVRELREESRPGGIRAHATGSFRNSLVAAMRRFRALRMV